jgi:hypothetical protein
MRYSDTVISFIAVSGKAIGTRMHWLSCLTSAGRARQDWHRFSSVQGGD